MVVRIRGEDRDYYDVGSSWDPAPTPLYVRVRRRTALTRRAGVWRADGDDDPAAEALLARCATEALGLSEWGQATAVVLGFAGRCTAGVLAAGRAAWCHERLDQADLQHLLAAVGERLDLYELWRLEACASRIEDAGVAPYRELDAPIFTIRSAGFQRCVVERNPLLRAIHAESLVDPYAAWQALDQFLGNDLAKQVDPPNPIDDALRRDIHGFNASSFKREKGGPTRKRGRPRGDR